MEFLLGRNVVIWLLVSHVVGDVAPENVVLTDGSHLRCELGRKQIRLEDLCNDQQDCADNLDEALCGCTDRLKLCSKGVCQKNPDVPMSVCAPCPQGYKHNGEQCEDIDECQFSGCGYGNSCLNFEGGHTCVACPRGFEAKMLSVRYFKSVDDSPTNPLRKLFLCDDLNECSSGDPCSAGKGVCVNQVGHYSCQCPALHEVQGNVCRAIGSEPPLLAIAENTSLFVYNLHSRSLLETVRVEQRIVDLVAYKNSVFYAFPTEIWQYKFDTKSHALLIGYEKQDQTMTSIKKIAVDWVLKRIYFLTAGAIYCTDFFGQGGAILRHRSSITSIAVDPVARYLFYTERNFVKRVHLDGSKESKLLIFTAHDKVEYENTPTGQALVVDPNLSRLYYINDRILYTIGYDGRFSRVVRTHAPFACIEPFEDRIYGVYRASASHPVSLPRIGYSIGGAVGNATVLEFKSITKPVALTVVSAAKFPGVEGTIQPCRRRDACSSDWCFHLPRPRTGKRCACLPGETENCTQITIQSFRRSNSVSSEINSASTVSALLGLVVIVESLWIFACNRDRIN